MNPFQPNRSPRVGKRAFSISCVLLLILNWTNLTVPAASSLTLTFAATAQGPTDATIRFANTADIFADGVTLERTAWVVVAPKPGGDTQPPWQIA